MNNLKEECKKYVLDKSQSGAYDLAGSIEEEIGDLYNFINQNYISKEQILNLECLKEERLLKLENWQIPMIIVREIKEEIKKL